MSLLPRERVFQTLDHQEPDRVPTALGGGPYGVVDEVYHKLVDLYDLGAPVPPFRNGHSISFMDDRLLDKLGTDIRYVFPNLLPNSPVHPGNDDDSFMDSYGQVWHRAVPYYYAGEGLLSTLTTGEDISSLLQFPDPHALKWMKGVSSRAEYLRTHTDHFVTMRMVASHGPFQTACDLRGTENFLMDMALDPDFARDLLEKIGNFQDALYRNAMEAGGQYFDMIELPGDDYASNVSTIISPTMFRKLIKPILARFISTIRSSRPGIKIMFHSDGLITPLLDDLIEIGIDVIHPLEPLEDMNFIEIKRRYGHNITFLGGIDIRHALPGSRSEILKEVQTRIQQLGPGGGYILAPSNHIQADVPPENVQYLYQTARKLGAYPIS